MTTKDTVRALLDRLPTRCTKLDRRTWSSMRTILIGLAVIGLLSCGGSGPTGPDSVLDRIEIAPFPVVLSRAGSTVQFTATARDKAGNAMTPQPSFSWSSGNLTVATIAPSGPATALATVLTRCINCGTCTRITATAGSVIGETYLAYEGSIEQFPCPPQ